MPLYRVGEQEQYKVRNIRDRYALAQFRASIRRVVGNLSFPQHSSFFCFFSFLFIDSSVSTLEDSFFREEVRYTVYCYVCSRLCLRAFFSAVLMSFFFGERVILIEIENVIGHIYFTRTMYHGSSIVYLSDNKIYCKI